jgi:hypothetical protein
MSPINTRPRAAGRQTSPMDSTITVFSVVCTTAAGLCACYSSLIAKKFGGWFTVGEMAFYAVVLFTGTVAAGRASSWSCGVGGGLVLTLIVLVIYRCWWEHRKRQRLSTRLGNLCPGGSWSRAEAFEQALCVLYDLVIFISIGCH